MHFVLHFRYYSLFCVVLRNLEELVVVVHFLVAGLFVEEKGGESVRQIVDVDNDAVLDSNEMTFRLS